MNQREVLKLKKLKWLYLRIRISDTRIHNMVCSDNVGFTIRFVQTMLLLQVSWNYWPGTFVPIFFYWPAELRRALRVYWPADLRSELSVRQIGAKVLTTRGGQQHLLEILAPNGNSPSFINHDIDCTNSEHVLELLQRPTDIPYCSFLSLIIILFEIK